MVAEGDSRLTHVVSEGMKDALTKEVNEKALAIIDERMSGHWNLDDERWAGHTREHVLQDRALDVAEKARAEALKLSNTNLESYKATANEFRGALKDQALLFVTKSEQDAWYSRISVLENERIARDAADREREKSRIEEKERDRAERSRQQWQLGIGVTVISVVVGVISRFIN